MNIDEFWAVVEKVKNSDEPGNLIKEELANLAPEDIASYQQHFDAFHEKAYRWDLWGAAYLIGGGCSDDGFTDFRYGLIAKGRSVFEKALDNPDSLAELGPQADVQNESFGYAAGDVYEEKTGNEIPYAEISGSEDPIGEDWDFDDESENWKRLPQLMKLYR